MEKYSVYLISHNNSNHHYIGKTNNIKQRLRQHYADSRKKNKTFIHQWIRKYPDFNVDILEDNLDESISFIYEKMYIGLFKSWNINLMNLTEGGEGVSGYRHNNLTKKIISEMNNNKKYSDESRKIMSEKKIGEKHPLYGKFVSIQTKYRNAMSSTKKHFPVNVYDLNGNFINNFDSHITAKYSIYSDISFSTGEILANCNRKQLTCHGFIIQYQNDDKIDEVLFRIKNSSVKNKKDIIQYDLSMNYIATYNSSYQAEKILRTQNINIYSADIRNCCEGKCKTVKGFIWKYEDKPINEIILPNNDISLDIKKKSNKNLSILNIPVISNDINTFKQYLINLNQNIECFDNFIKINKHNLIISYNSSKTHNSTTVTKKYFIENINKYNKQNLRLINIWEYDWNNKQSILKSQLENILKLTPNKIPARKCIIREIHSHTSNVFLKENHLQGYTISKINLGLFYNDELVSIMTFGPLRKNLGRKSIDNHYELLRFCNKLNTTVVGGASKLFKYFIKHYNPQHIISYANRDWSNGNLYKNLNMVEEYSTEPGYDWYKDEIKYNRFKFRKSELIKAGYEPDKTEDNIMIERGYLKVYNSGNLKYTYTPTH